MCQFIFLSLLSDFDNCDYLLNIYFLVASIFFKENTTKIVPHHGTT